MPKTDFFVGHRPVVLFEKDQKDIFFSLAQRKEVKETSTYPKSFPIWKNLTVQAGRPAFTDFSEVKSTIKGRFWLFIGCASATSIFSALFLYFFCAVAE